jgi:hypothetical protein
MPNNSTTHGCASGGSITTELRSYYHARERCNNPNVKNWADYGGRGIKFLFTSFEQFVLELGKKPKGKTLDRIDNDGDYEPGNVRWATWEQQRANQRKQRGTTSKHKGIHYKKESKKWIARLKSEEGLYGGLLRVYVGSYNTEEEAKAALDAAQKSAPHGEKISSENAVPVIPKFPPAPDCVVATVIPVEVKLG